MHLSDVLSEPHNYCCSNLNYHSSVSLINFVLLVVFEHKGHPTLRFIFSSSVCPISLFLLIHSCHFQLEVFAFNLCHRRWLEKHWKNNDIWCVSIALPVLMSNCQTSKQEKRYNHLINQRVQNLLCFYNFCHWEKFSQFLPYLFNCDEERKLCTFYHRYLYSIMHREYLSVQSQWWVFHFGGVLIDNVGAWVSVRVR